MAQLLKMSEAAAIAVHAGVVVGAHRPRPVSLSSLAGELDISRDHGSKVMQRLSKVGLVSPVRGPAGGYKLAVDPERTLLLAFYEAVEGELSDTRCLFAEPRCRFGLSQCMFSDALSQASNLVREALSTPLSSVIEEYNTTTPGMLRGQHTGTTPQPNNRPVDAVTTEK